MTRETAEIVTTADALIALADDINREHERARACVAQGLEHAKRAGELLQQAKATLPHGDWLTWLREHCEVSERTAQGYMRLARCWPQLEANPQRVADLSLREALTTLAKNVGQLNALPDAERLAVMDRVEQTGVEISRSIGDVQREERYARHHTLPTGLVPLTVAEGRKRRLRRNEDKRLWEVEIGPNRAGLELKSLVDAQRGSAFCQGAVAEAERLRAEAAELEEQARRTRERAQEVLAAADVAIRDALEQEHGEIYSMCETHMFCVDDADTDAWLKRLSTREIIDWLLEHRGSEAQEIERGYWGDMLLMRFSSHAIVPALNPRADSWTRIGGVDGLPHEDDRAASRQIGGGD